jgi:hypothetical protein
MYRTDCFPENSPRYHTLVFGEVQTMDCCMTLPSDLSYPLLWFVAPLILGWPFGLLISDSILVTKLCTIVFTLWL